MDTPDGTGSLTISRMTIEADSVSLDFEGKVEGYGTVFATHELSYIAEDRSRGRLVGEARTFLEDGTLINTPHMGTFTRAGSQVHLLLHRCDQPGHRQFCCMGYRHPR